MDWLPMLYNSLWTSLTCLFAYAIERDVVYDVSKNYPKLYEAGQQNQYFTLWIFWKWVILALFHGVITFFGCTYGFSGIIDSSGKTDDFWFASTIAFSSIIHLVTCKLAIELNFLNVVAIIAGVGSLLFYWLFVIVFNTAFFSQLLQPELEYVYFRIFSNFNAWLAIFFVPLIALLPDMTIKYFGKLYYPDASDQIIARTYKRDKSFIQTWKNKNDSSTKSLDSAPEHGKNFQNLENHRSPKRNLRPNENSVGFDHTRRKLRNNSYKIREIQVDSDRGSVDKRENISKITPKAISRAIRSSLELKPAMLTKIRSMKTNRNRSCTQLQEFEASHKAKIINSHRGGYSSKLRPKRQNMHLTSQSSNNKLKIPLSHTPSQRIRKNINTARKQHGSLPRNISHKTKSKEVLQVLRLSQVHKKHNLLLY